MGLIHAVAILARDNRFRNPDSRVEMFGNEFRWDKTKVFNPSGLNMAHFIQTSICFPFRSLAASVPYLIC